MPLALGFRSGQDVYIDDHRFLVFAVDSPVRFKLKNEETEEVFQITEQEWVLVLPKVWVQAGVQHMLDDLGLARAIFEAPRTIKIYRGDIWRQRRVK